MLASLAIRPRVCHRHQTWLPSMHPTLPLTRDLVLIGGGHAHALVLKQWAMRPLPGARLTLIDPHPTTAYTGMLPGFVAGHYDREALDIDLVRLTRAAGARFILAEASGIDPDSRRIAIADRAPIRFDVASLDIGATGRTPDIPGFAEHVVTAKPLAQFADHWAEFTTTVQRGRARPRVVVIGAGAAGCELALAAHHRLTSLGFTPEVTLVEQHDRVGPGLSAWARRQLTATLMAAGVTVVTSAQIRSIDAGGLTLSDQRIDADFILGTAGVQPWPWVSETGLAEHEGWVRVDAHLRSISHPHIFAAGDCAHLDHAPRPKAGVYAVRAGRILADNLRAALQDRAPDQKFTPQTDYLKLISTGGRSAVAEKYGIAFQSSSGWWLKDFIDRRFMARLNDLEPMVADRVGGPMAAGVKELVTDTQPLCGGCGSKTGRHALGEGLSGLAGPQRDDVLAGTGDDAAVLKAGDQQQVLTTDHVRAFVEDPGLFARITAVHALGDVWASGAKPQAALATLILPPMADRLQAATIAEIMEAAGRVFANAGADIVGGHTSTGAELSLGFTVTGLTSKAVQQGRAVQGDVLLLTKPLGTGVLLAGEMAMRAKGRDAASCWASMARPQNVAADILSPVATAMTDVTGFGLAGHLATLLGQASARLALDKIPLLPGALDLAAAGVRSTLFEANRLSKDVLDTPGEPRSDLLIDPQTSGGLLASIPAAEVDRVMAEFRAAEEPVWRIGEVTETSAERAQITAR